MTAEKPVQDEEKIIASTGWKRDGFKDEEMFVLPTESFRPYLKDPVVQRMYVTDIGYFPNARHHYRERREGADGNILLYCTAGHGVVEFSGQTLTLEENEAVVIPARAAHRYYALDDAPWSLLWMHFKGEDCALCPVEKGEKIIFASHYAQNRLFLLFSMIFRTLHTDYDLGNFRYIGRVAESILSEVYDRSKPVEFSGPERQVTELVRYMNDHIREVVTMDDLAACSGLSESYINRIFKKSTGMPPMRFFQDLKMRMARGIFDNNRDIRVYDVALQMGYTDPYYFSRVFRKVVGVSPSAYLQSGNIPGNGLKDNE